MADTGYISPGTMADDSAVGSRTWSNPDNAKANDGSYASYGIAYGPEYSHYLKATNFGFSIPSGATIDGIKVEIEGKTDADTAGNDYRVSIVKSDGTVGTTNKGNNTMLESSDTYRTYGGATDLWGETWSDTDINDTDFGVVYEGLLEDSGHEQCLVGGTKVHTPSGLINIEDIKVGSEVVSFDEKTLEETISTVINTHKTKKDRTLTIKTNINKISVTETQLFYIEGKILKASELKVGSIVSIYKNGNTTNEKIKSIEINNKEATVYDITITNPKLYSADNFIVHNAFIFVDHIRIKVYYTVASATIQGISTIQGIQSITL